MDRREHADLLGAGATGKDAPLADRVKQMIGHIVRQILEQRDWVLDQTDVKVQSVPFSKAARYRRPHWITFHALRNTSDPRDVVLTNRRQNATLPTDTRWSYFATFASPLKASVGFGARNIRQLRQHVRADGYSVCASSGCAEGVISMAHHSHIMLIDRKTRCCSLGDRKAMP